MFWITILISVIVAYNLFCYLKTSWKYRQYPGPPTWLSFPLVGHTYLLGEDPMQTLGELHKKYGPIFRFDFGAFPTLVVCDYDLINEGFKSEGLSGRSYGAYKSIQSFRGVDSKGQTGGMSFCHGKTHQDLRKFFIGTLSSLVTGSKDSREAILAHEVTEFCTNLSKTINSGEESNKGQVLDAENMFFPATLNVIWSVTFGKLIPQGDPEVMWMAEKVQQWMDGLAPNLRSLVQLSSTFLLKLSHKLGIGNVMSPELAMAKLFRQKIAERSPDAQGDFIERYCAEMAKARPDSTFYGPDALIHLPTTLTELFTAGSEATAKSLEWFLLYMITYPDAQAKLQAELDQVFARDEPVNLKFTDLTVYTNAFMEEMMRHDRLQEMAVPHLAIRDTEIRGYRFPKGTQIVPFYASYQRNPKIFPEPDAFKPERFIVQTESGPAFQASKHIHYFGVGKRRCPGELLARSLFYLFVVELTRKFHFSPVQGEKINFEPKQGLAWGPKPFKVLVRNRTA